jgi:hypothetical protein
MPNPLVVRTSAGSRPQANLEMKDLSFLLGHSRSELGSYELQRLSSVTNLRRDLFEAVAKHCRKGKRGGVPILRSSHLRDAGAPGSSRQWDEAQFEINKIIDQLGLRDRTTSTSWCR